MDVFVTGGTGFLGANLVAGLNERGIRPRILRRESSSLRALEGLKYDSLIGDILDPIDVLAGFMEGCDRVFHVAAVSDYWRQDPKWLYRVNVEGTEQILAAALEAGVDRLVFTSSLAAAGLPQDGRLVDENGRFNLEPREWPYGHSKHLAEIAVRRAVDRGLSAVIVNPTVVLGPRDVNQISGSIVLEAARGRLRFYSPGGGNFVAVEDVVAGHLAAAERGRVGERYILAGQNLSYRELVTMVCEVAGRPPPWIRVPGWILPVAGMGLMVSRKVLGNRLPLDDLQVRLMGINLYVNGQKAIDELAMPQTPARLAVQETFDWYYEHDYL